MNLNEPVVRRQRSDECVELVIKLEDVGVVRRFDELLEVMLRNQEKEKRSASSSRSRKRR